MHLHHTVTAGCNPPCLFCSGAHLFRQFSIRDFHTQQRAPDDPHHIALIDNIYKCSSAPPITAARLQPYKVLTSADLQNEPGWRHAPILVSSNVERDTLNFNQAVRFGLDHGHPVVRWRLPGKSVRVPQTAYDDNPSVWGFFVRDGPAMLTENISVKRSLCNGTLGRMHSLTFAQATPGEAHNAYVAQQLIANADPGAIVDLPDGLMPLTINFLPDPKDAAGTPRPVTPSLFEHDLVIPVPLQRTKPLKEQPWWRITDANTGEEHFRRLTLKDHAIKLAFAITFWKVC